LQRKELRAEIIITVPNERLQESRYADTVHVEPGDVHAPAGGTVVMVEGRNRIPVTLHRLGERRPSVHLEHAQEEPPVGPVVLEPPTVLVRGPQEVLDRARWIPTVPSELPTRPLRAAPSAAGGRVPLVQELEGRPVRVVPDHVQVRVPAQARKLYD